MLKAVIAFFVLALVAAVASALSYIIGVTRGFGECYDLLKEQGKIKDEHPEEEEA